MSGILDQFRKKVVRSVWKEKEVKSESAALNDKIALGVLLWVVAQADKEFLPEEKSKIKDVLREYGNIPETQMPVILESIQVAEKERIDLYTFTREVNQDLSYEARKGIIENLFRVACADNDLDHEEHEVIRKISGLFQLDHKDFIEAKIKVKKEFGMDTAGL